MEGPANVMSLSTTSTPSWTAQPSGLHTHTRTHARTHARAHTYILCRLLTPFRGRSMHVILGHPHFISLAYFKVQIYFKNGDRSSLVISGRLTANCQACTWLTRTCTLFCLTALLWKYSRPTACEQFTDSVWLGIIRSWLEPVANSVWLTRSLPDNRRLATGGRTTNWWRAPQAISTTGIQNLKGMATFRPACTTGPSWWAMCIKTRTRRSGSQGFTTSDVSPVECRCVHGSPALWPLTVVPLRCGHSLSKDL